MLKEFIVKLTKVIGLILVLPSSAQIITGRNNAENSVSLPNPYGQQPFDISAIQPAMTSQECDYLTGATVTHTKSNKVTAKNYEHLCLRTMAEPNSKYLKYAVFDAARAIKQKDMDRFHHILRSWPVETRKEIHDKAFAKAKKWGAKVESSMPAWQGIKNENDRFFARPHYQNQIAEPVQFEVTNFMGNRI